MTFEVVCMCSLATHIHPEVEQYKGVNVDWNDTVAKWLKHSMGDQKSQDWIPPFASQVKCFLHPSTPWETILWLKGLEVKIEHLCLLPFWIFLNYKTNLNFYMAVVSKFSRQCYSNRLCIENLSISCVSILLVTCIWLANKNLWTPCACGSDYPMEACEVAAMLDTNPRSPFLYLHVLCELLVKIDRLVNY